LSFEAVTVSKKRKKEREFRPTLQQTHPLYTIHLCGSRRLRHTDPHVLVLALHLRKPTPHQGAALQIDQHSCREEQVEELPMTAQ
jgi:hypothetical protein